MTKGNSILRHQNEKRILGFLRTHQTSSRLEIANEFKLSKNTVSLIIEKFIQDGIVREIGFEEPGKVGRPIIKIALVPEAYKSVGILIKDKHGQFVVTDYCSNILEKDDFSLNTKNEDECLQQLIEICRTLLGRHPEIIGIGIGIPGIVDPNLGFVHYSSHLDWKNVAVKEKLSEKLPVHLRILNSVKATALTPFHGILEENATSVLYVRIDEGVGGAFIIGKDIYYGGSWTAGEVGHLSVDSEGPMCSCGQKGCLETLISIPAILEKIKKKHPKELLDGKQQFLDRLAAGKLTFDPGLEDIFREAGEYLGIALSQIVNVCNPEYIIVDSPFEKVNVFQQATVNTAEKRALRFPFEQTKFLFAKNRFSSLIGASLSVIHDFENDINW